MNWCDPDRRLSVEESVRCPWSSASGRRRDRLLVFDTYRVSQAVARFPVPVITGIGHHQDVSITDRMAHTQTKTPTQAAEFILAHETAVSRSRCWNCRASWSFVQQLLADHREVLIETQSRHFPARTRVPFYLQGAC